MDNLPDPCFVYSQLWADAVSFTGKKVRVQHKYDTYLEPQEYPSHKRMLVIARIITLYRDKRWQCTTGAWIFDNDTQLQCYVFTEIFKLQVRT